MRLIDADALLYDLEIVPLTGDGGVDANDLEDIVKRQPTIEPKQGDDLIRRKDAIKKICEDGTWLERQGCYEITMAERKQRDADILSDLPSAQPKIVRCKECRHWHEKDGLTYCDRIDYGYGYNADDFCSYGERMTNS